MAGRPRPSPVRQLFSGPQGVRNIVIATVAGALVVALAAYLVVQESAAFHPGIMRIPRSSSQYADENYSVVVAEIEGAGFTNVTARPLGDLVVGWLHDENSVDKVFVDGKSEYSTDSWLASDVPIVVEYHS